MAILVDGRVLSAPVVKEPITTSSVVLALATPAEADAVAAQLRGTTTPLIAAAAGHRAEGPNAEAAQP